MKAVRYVDPAGATRIGRLDDERVVDAGPAGPIGFVPDDEGWAEVEAASGDEHPRRQCKYPDVSTRRSRVHCRHPRTTNRS